MTIPQAVPQVAILISAKAGLTSLLLNLLVHWGCMQDIGDVCVLGIFSILEYSGGYYDGVLLLSNVSYKYNYLQVDICQSVCTKSTFL